MNIPNVLSVIGPVPDEVIVETTNKASTRGRYILRPSTRCAFSISCTFNLPLRFKRSFCIGCEVTIGNLPRVISRMLKCNSGVVVNKGFFGSLPLTIGLAIRLLSTRNGEVPFMSRTKIRGVTPYLLSNSTSSASLRIVMLLRGPRSTTEVTSLRLILRTSSKITKIRISRKSCLRTTLRLILPRKIAISLTRLPRVLGNSNSRSSIGGAGEWSKGL